MKWTGRRGTLPAKGDAVNDWTGGQRGQVLGVGMGINGWTSERAGGRGVRVVAASERVELQAGT